MKQIDSAHDHLLYLESGLQIGQFWVAKDNRSFADTGPIQNHVLVFPAWPVEISYGRREKVLAEPNRAMCYNRGCEYRRRALNPHGDRCWWIAYDDDALALSLGQTPERPFRCRWTPVPRDAYLTMRALTAALSTPHEMDQFELQDRAWWLLARCLDARQTMPNGSRRQRIAVDRARAFLAEHFRQPVRLADVAAAASLSPFHLSRLFHRVTGTRLHQYLMDLRLRQAVPDIIDSTRHLTDIALDVGFSSPSHFSSTFRTCFGRSPSRLRNRLWAREVLAQPFDQTRTRCAIF